MVLQIKAVKTGTKEEIDFLVLPHKIYRQQDLMQSSTEVQAYIAGQAPLSSTLIFQAFVGYEKEEVVIRGAIIQSLDTTDVYLGFFEALNQPQWMAPFMAHLTDYARSIRATSIQGPVQGSFWSGYRMKLNDFERTPFTGEPHNPAYYPVLWSSVGFKLKERYVSNFYQAVPTNFQAKRFRMRYDQFRELGYQIESPDKADWDQVIGEVFFLLSKLYQDFPLFQRIDLKQFKSIFNFYHEILDFSMVKLAYKEDQLVGFLISLPDYGNLVYRPLNLLNLLKIYRIRRQAKRYIILYLGVDSQHLGLGTALSYPIFKAVEARQAQAVGALIRQQTVTKSYLKELQQDTTEYGLFELNF